MKVAFYTLGCKVNQYETEALKEQFRNKNHEVVDAEEKADAYVINTCTVTRLADRKSRQYIRRMKKKNPECIIAVTGCYAQISPEEVKSIEEVDIITGTNKKNELIRLVESTYKKNGKNKECLIDKYSDLNEYMYMGIVAPLDNRVRSYIKVQEGCNRFCSYCIIPYARGKVRSRNIEEIVNEASNLIANGCKEIVLTGINTALYGMEKDFENHDDENTQGIALAVKHINNIEGNFRIRLSSLEPTVINESYVKELMKYEKLCPHLHLSIQSGSNSVLKAMNRNYTNEDYIKISNALKKHDNGYGITTDIIVGFPGEDEKDFSDTIEIVEKIEFCKVHVFKFSKRQGTRAEKMDNQIPSELKNERSKKLIKIAENSSKNFFTRNIGVKRVVLVEEYIRSSKLLIGYTENYIKTYIQVESQNEEDISKIVNNFVEVNLIELYEDGMKAEIIKFTK